MPAGGIRIDWPASDQPAYQGVCPNCGAAGDKPHVLDVAWVAPKLPQGDRKPVYMCPSCTARFYPPLKVPNYHDPDVMDWGWHQFHIQQGAGLVPITAPLGRIDRPGGTRFLEIGCGYGFGLDFAIHALGWEGMGIDPSPMARLGAADLAIEIRDGYFPQADPEARIWDVIAATEVIEHVEQPPALLAALRARLARDGVLLLTTPDGEAIRRETPEAALAQLLAPGIHMVFQTEASLRRLFAAAGFGDVVVGRDGLTLVAYAGAIAGVVTDERADHRARFRNYLAARAAAVPTGSDLGLGFAGRAMFEAVVDLDWAAARTARGLLWPAIRARFGLDLDELREVPADFFGIGLAALKDAMPLNLGMILYAEASRLRAEPVLRPQAGAMFTLAGMAAQALHSALAQATLNDGLAEELVWRGAAEAAIEAARVAAPETLGRVDYLRSLPVGRGELAAATWRVVVELVNQGAIDPAREMVGRYGLLDELDDLPALVRRDAMIVRGQMALAPDGDPAEAMMIAGMMDAGETAADEILLGGFVRLTNGGRYGEAALHIGAVSAAALRREDDVAADARAALAIVIERTADPVAVPGLLRGVALDPARRDQIVLEAFCRLVDAGRHEEAILFVDAENIVSRAVARDDVAGHDARLALALLDLATGDPMDVPARLAGLAIDEARRCELIIGAFSRLVNAARYQDAEAFARAEGIEAMADPATLEGLDAVIGLAILDLVTGDPAMAPRRIAGVGIDEERRRQITLGAFVTLVNRGRYDEAIDLREGAPIEAWARRGDDEDGADASIALVALALVRGDPADVPHLVARLPGLTAVACADARAQAALRLIHLGREDEARPLFGMIDITLLDPASRADLIATEARFAAESGDIEGLVGLLDMLDADAEPARVQALATAGFVTAVARGDFAGAGRLRSRIEKDFVNYAKATTEGLRSAGYALGVLDLQEPAQPHRAEAAFAAVRRGFALELGEGEAAPALFWESLRGEIIALHRTDRAAEATALGRAMLKRYQGAPDDLAAELTGGGHDDGGVAPALARGQRGSCGGHACGGRGARAVAQPASGDRQQAGHRDFARAESGAVFALGSRRAGSRGVVQLYRATGGIGTVGRFRDQCGQDRAQCRGAASDPVRGRAGAAQYRV